MHAHTTMHSLYIHTQACIYTCINMPAYIYIYIAKLLKTNRGYHSLALNYNPQPSTIHRNPNPKLLKTNRGYHSLALNYNPQPSTLHRNPNPKLLKTNRMYHSVLH